MRTGARDVLSARSTAWWLVLLGASSIVPSFHCANAGAAIAPADLDAGLLPPEAGPSDEGGAFNNGTGPIPDDVECAETTKQIYVLATDKALYRFYPEKVQFVHVGQVACPTSAGTFSMAIDRHGTAWVEYTDGRIFAVDTADATCKTTAFQPGQTGFETFGMGYSLNGDSANGETLFVSGAGLASLDTKTFELSFKGSLTYGRTELTGLDKQLFAFSVGSGVIAGLNKTTGATEVVYRTSAVDEQAAFAFAQWGGDFWVFTGDNHSIVTQYSPADNTSTVRMKDTGMLIVGAGSSTCAPSVKPPH
jgi:hypothetical protein